MINYYLKRLATRPTEERQTYLDETVVEKFREQVKEQWNQEHPEETLV